METFISSKLKPFQAFQTKELKPEETVQEVKPWREKKKSIAF